MNSLSTSTSSEKSLLNRFVVGKQEKNIEQVKAREASITNAFKIAGTVVDKEKKSEALYNIYKSFLTIYKENTSECNKTFISPEKNKTSETHIKDMITRVGITKQFHQYHAKKMLFQAYGVAVNIPNNITRDRAFCEISKLYAQEGNMSMAVPIAEKICGNKEKYYTFYNICFDALFFYKKAMSDRTKESTNIANAMVNLAHDLANRIPKTENFLKDNVICEISKVYAQERNTKRANEFAEKITDNVIQGAAFSNISKVYAQEGDTKMANEFAEKVPSVGAMRSRALNYISEVSERQEENIKKANELAKKVPFVPAISTAFNYISKVSERRGKLKIKPILKLKDSITLTQKKVTILQFYKPDKCFIYPRENENENENEKE